MKEPLLKLVIAMWKHPEIDEETFNRRWSGAHADLLRSKAEALRVVRYVQSHKCRIPPVDEALKQRYGSDAPDGLVELFWTSEAEMKEAMASPEGQEASAALVEDEKTLCDPSRMSSFFSMEEVVVG